MAKNFASMGETTIGGVNSSGDAQHAIVDYSGSLIFVDYAHYAIHSGDHYFFTDKFTLANAATKEYLIQTPSSGYAHFHFVFDGSAITQFDVYESAGWVGTTDNLQTLFNNNRNSTNESDLLIYTSPTTDSGDGTLLKTYKGGSATNQSVAGEVESSEEEIILKQNTKYLIRYTSGSDANLCDINLIWYERE